MKSIPEGLKPQECERGGCIKPPIAYIPEKEIVKSQVRTLKIKVSHDMHLTFTVFHQGTPEQFLSHVQMVLETIHQSKIDKAYQDACKDNVEAEKQLAKATEAKDSYRGMDENPLVIKFWKKATAAKTRTGENIESTIQAIFLQYSTLLSEEGSRPWAKVIKEHCASSCLCRLRHSSNCTLSNITNVINQWLTP
jgi:hypothetical protein